MKNIQVPLFHSILPIYLLTCISVHIHKSVCQAYESLKWYRKIQAFQPTVAVNGIYAVVYDYMNGESAVQS